MSVLSEILILIVTAIHRFVVIVTRYLCKNFIYGEKGQKVPPIRNPILLESATSLAAKIRTGKLTSVEVMKAFIERIRVCSH